MRLSDLIGVDRQVEQLGRNTRQFLDGLPANHALLWGSRGTGKSSLVRALLAEHAEAGLRLIEIERDHLADLPRVVEQIAKLPQRFVLFCDDLSFESGEGDYRVLKSVLDGSLEQAPDNVLLYATSNRRHLVPEKESDNENWKRVDGELHPSEAVEDKIALSDRFGLWLSFYPFTQEHFLDVVEHWIGQLADKAGLPWQRTEELDVLAVRWATGRGNRNGPQGMIDLQKSGQGLEGYGMLHAQLESLLADERDFIANAAQFSAFLFNQLEGLNWAGFYLNRDGELVLGPFQGQIACVRIPFGRGVCGTAAATLQTQRVEDVHAFAGHIACDSASNSELVVPLVKDGRLIGVLDLDSPQLARFTAQDQAGIEQLAAIFLRLTDC
eukprot:gene17273-17098_t